MAPHEKFLEMCAARTAGELTPAEQEQLEAHLAACSDCRRAMREYEIAAQHGVAALASEMIGEDSRADDSWSVEKAEKAFFERLKAESGLPENSFLKPDEVGIRGQRFTYHPSEIRWRELWMPFAAVIFLAFALCIAAYRNGIKSGTERVRTTAPSQEFVASLEEQASDAGHERAQLQDKLAEQDKTIAGLLRQLMDQQKAIAAFKARNGAKRVEETGEHQQQPGDADAARAAQVAAALAKLRELQETVDALARQREELTMRSLTLETKVSELTQTARDRQQELDQMQEQVAKDQDLLEHDRDIRELMGARDLYIAEVHDVAGDGQTTKTYGRVFYTKGKRLVFYAYDLDAQPGARNASTFQAWGRRGPDQKQARNLGVFYEDNLAKKRWVLKTSEAKTLEDIDAVFVTVEPSGGSQHPSGKQLLFAYLRVNPNHP
jgi:hypothetical protein